MKFKTKELVHELKHHLPFTAFATIFAILIILIINFFLKKEISESAFEIFHPLHVLVSAIATSAMFYKYKKNIFHSILVGIFGAVIIGTLSDVIFPYLGGSILNIKLSLHLPIISEYKIILTSAFIGAVLGILTKQTKTPHLIHVFLSVFASLTYLITFSQSSGILFLTKSFIIVFVAVVIPCCISDIVFPFFFLGKKIKQCACSNDN